MPHLTSVATGTASTGVRLGFGFPGYAHPLVAPVEWAGLARPGTPLDWAVLNVAGGPGAWPDPHCLQAVARLRNSARAQARDAARGARRPAGAGRVLGQVDARYGASSCGEFLSDAHRYRDWYRVDGLLIDHCPTERAALPEIRRTVGTLRYFTDRTARAGSADPWAGMPGYWDEIVSLLGPGVSE